ncbi:hypothetical protein KCU79_g167, partial [Aureobasidium melanogenum]
MLATTDKVFQMEDTNTGESEFFVLEEQYNLRRPISIGLSHRNKLICLSASSNIVLANLGRVILVEGLESRARIIAKGQVLSFSERQGAQSKVVIIRINQA